MSVRSRYPANNRPKTLKVYQANVGKTPEAHDIALALADAEDFDLVLLQEPWSKWEDGRCETKTHPAYKVFAPVNFWDSTSTRPRVMTYVRHNLEVDTNQIRPIETRDILWITTNNVTIVNIYRDPSIRNLLPALFDWHIPEKCLIAGDFNARHHSWEPGARSIHGGQYIADWAEEQGLSQLVPGVPTNPRNTTIDLAFTNIPLASASIEDHLASSSDHFTIAIAIPEVSLQFKPAKRPQLHTPEDIQRFLQLVKVGAQDLPITANSPEDIDLLASAISETIQTALHAAGRPARDTNRSAPWWTEDCAKAAIQHRKVRRANPLGFNKVVQQARRALRRVVRRAKRQFWRQIIDSVKDSAGIYKLARWAKRPSQFQPPPLQVNGVVYETQMQKATVLREAILERREAGDDIDDAWVPMAPIKALPFDLGVSLEQAKFAAIRTSSTSPGIDGITVKTLQLAWDLMGEHIRILYESCLRLGYYPKIFQHAEVAMVPKTGKRDLTSPRAWRPISLLSCLGKGLERLIARRLAWASVEYKVLHDQQAGALPKRSAIDLATALIHDIDHALAEGKVATLVTMDVQGAFDSVLRKRLTYRLREQGWPIELAKWVDSFMSYRSARVRLQDTTTDSAPLQCGLPQGSPVSPILFLLYTQPIYRLGVKKQRFGYADDVTMLQIGDTIIETTIAANKDISSLVTWGQENAISFDTGKTEVMHFANRKIQPLPIHHSGVQKLPEKAMRWLGVWFDQKLSFKIHVDKWAAKAKVLAYHLKGLANTQRGPLPAAMRRGILSCVVPILLYGAEAWFPGLTRPSVTHPHVTVRSGVQHLLDRLSSVLLHGIRAVLPTWITTPKNALYRESGIPPIDQLLEAQRLRFAIRLQGLDRRHPLVNRAKLEPQRPNDLPWTLRNAPRGRPSRSFQSRLQRTAALLDIGDPPRPLLLLKDSQAKPVQQHSKEDTVKDFQQWLATIPPNKILVYSDGSQQDGIVGWGYAIFSGNKHTASGHGRLDQAEVFDAEITGALKGVLAAVQLCPEAVNFTICVDSISAIASLWGTPSGSSQAEALEFQRLSRHHNIDVKWCPGHMGIIGNELADEQAKLGTGLPLTVDSRPTLAYTRRVVRQKIRDRFSLWWEAHAPLSYKALGLKASLNNLPELYITRPSLHHVIAARTGHGDFANYHLRFHPDSVTTLTCSCGRQKSPTHIFYCRKIPPSRRIRLGPRPSEIIQQVTGPEFPRLTKLIEATGFYTNICKRR